MPRYQPIVLYHGYTDEADGYKLVTLSVDGRRYNYLLTIPQAHTVEFLCKRVSGLRALGYAKSRAKLVAGWHSGAALT